MRARLIKAVLKHHKSTAVVAMRLAAGGLEGCPVSEDLIDEAVEIMLDTLGVGDSDDRKKLKSIPKYQPFRLYLVATFAQRINEPD